jgi:nucleoside-diphosphate-sugar epimerase
VPLGVGELDHSIGDVTEPALVEAGMNGCDAVLHAASVYSLDVRAAKQMREVNVRGAETVLSAAGRLQIDPTVVVSSLAALYPPNGKVLNEDSTVQDPPGAYYKSKAEAERIARRYQERGAPVVTSYPGMTVGPQDPHFGESSQTVANILKRRLPLVPEGGLSVVDVRDLAQAHAAMFEQHRGPRRYILSGTNMSFSSIIQTVQEVTGRRIPHLTLPAWSLAPAVRGAGLLQRMLPFRLPLNTEGFDAIRWNPRGDDSRAQADLDFSPRAPRATFADTIEWLQEAGKISPTQAGRLARSSR